MAAPYSNAHANSDLHTKLTEVPCASGGLRCISAPARPPARCWCNSRAPTDCSTATYVGRSGWHPICLSLLMQKIYFVHGHRVERRSDPRGHSVWVCDCAEYRRARSQENESCEHLRRVEAAARIERLLRVRDHALPSPGC
jgi:hypothetical protein